MDAEFPGFCSIHPDTGYRIRSVGAGARTQVYCPACDDEVDQYFEEALPEPAPATSADQVATLFEKVGTLEAEVETLRKNRDALAHGEKVALQLMAAEKARATTAETALATVTAERDAARALSDERFAEIKRAQAIIDGLAMYRERLVTVPMQSTELMRARIRELAEPARDDFDRAVIAALDDLDAMIALAALTPPASDGEG